MDDEDPGGGEDGPSLNVTVVLPSAPAKELARVKSIHPHLTSLELITALARHCFIPHHQYRTAYTACFFVHLLRIIRAQTSLFKFEARMTAE